MRGAALAGLVLALAGQARADETAAFLKLGVGARALGMGGAYTALADDVTALSWNPAGLSSLSRRELGAMDAGLGLGSRLDFLGFASPVARGTLGVGAVRLSQGGVEARDASGRPTGSFTAADEAIGVSYGTKLAEGTRLGGGFKFVHSRVAEASAQTFAVDLGGQRELGLTGPGTPLVGLAVLNLGPGLRFDDQTAQLPLTIAAGLGYRLPAGLVLALDYKNRPHSHASEVSAGTEYAVFSGFAVRAGYGSGRAAAAASAGPATRLNGLAMGFGLKLRSCSLDYAVTPFGELGSIQRFSLGARF